MAQLTIQSVTQAGATITPVAAAAGGDAFANTNDESTVLEVTNGGGSPITVTITPPNSSYRLPGVGPVTVAAIVVSVPNAGSRRIGPFPAAVWNDVSGNVNAAYSGVTTVTVAAVRVTPVGR